MRALYAVGHYYEPPASGVRALYVVRHFFEPPVPYTWGSVQSTRPDKSSSRSPRVRALYAAGQDFEPLASGARAFYAVGHLFEPLASGVRALYASWHSFEQLASGVSALYEAGYLFEPLASWVRALYAAGYLFEPLASGVRALYAAGHFFLNQLLPKPALAVLNSLAGYLEPRHGAFLHGAAGSELNESSEPGQTPTRVLSVPYLSLSLEHLRWRRDFERSLSLVACDLISYHVTIIIIISEDHLKTVSCISNGTLKRASSW